LMCRAAEMACSPTNTRSSSGSPSSSSASRPYVLHVDVPNGGASCCRGSTVAGQITHILTPKLNWKCVFQTGFTAQGACQRTP
jgi:hypothetical protein